MPCWAAVCYPAFRVCFFGARFAERATTRRPSAPCFRLRARMMASRSFPCSAAIAARMARTSSTIGSFAMISGLHQFFRRADGRRRKASASARVLNLATNRGVRDVRTIPRDQIAHVIHGGDGNVDGIQIRLRGHGMAAEQSPRELIHVVAQVKHGNLRQKRETPRRHSSVAARYFIDNRLRHNELEPISPFPPFMGELLVCRHDDVATWRCRQVAYNRRFNVRSGSHRLFG